MLAVRSSPSASNLAPAAVASFYIADGEIARESPASQLLLASGFSGASALEGSGLQLQNTAAPTAQLSENVAAANVFGRIPSSAGFLGRPAFYDSDSNTLWDREQGWIWASSGPSTAASLPVAGSTHLSGRAGRSCSTANLTTARSSSGYEASAYITQF